MSTAEQKAKELIQKFRIFVGVITDADNEPINQYLTSKSTAKKAALICVEEILAEIDYRTATNRVMDNRYGFWNEVKQYLLTQK